MQVTVETAKELGILPEEFDKIKEVLGRTPNFTELSIYSVVWSEHCSYKNSIVWLKTLPKDSERMLAKAGEENAGLVDIGDGLACCFKIESHNHPSAIEPYQGAATGVGGINRDIFSMGARPIAQLNSLRFGKLESDRTKWLMRGVVKGIGNYGNAFGIPTVGGEVYFEECYHTNNLVNAMSVGIVEVGKTVSASADGPGNPVYIFGAATGKDGIHGAAFASKDISEDSHEDLPSVQVGDPFWEKLILEASMEIIQTGAVVGMQDMGAAGITCSTSEMSAKSGTGMEIHLDRVPMRQPDMKDWEILLSESQERMLVILHKGMEKEVEKILEKWDLTYAQIGTVTDSGRVQYYMHGELCADIPAESLVLGGGAPVYHREYREPAYFKEIAAFDASKIEVPSDLKEVARKMVNLPNIASKRWIYRQYDSMVGTINQGTNKPSDASIVKIRDTERSIAMSVDCNSRFVYANPEVGAAIAVSEAARNIVCTGADPVAITNCLNFGNPYNPEVYYQFVGAIKGMKTACEALGTPVTGGNVSFYNQSTIDGTAVFPTPTIGMVGILEKPAHHMTLDFKNEGDVILLVGPVNDDIASSQYLVNWHKVEKSPAPFFDMSIEKKVQSGVLKAIRSGLVASAHDLSEGGLFVSLLESGFASGKGFEISTPSGIRKDAFLFGEGQSRVVLTCKATYAEALKQQLEEKGLDVMEIGAVQGTAAVVDGENFGEIASFQSDYDTLIEKAMA
ncbi:MAG: phosphoribosylformylglycinamidine synthase subunit PurL [Bacteroidota bacterium]|nr:phosphoribosylformylglycinamidine synthase subunit PurL [Bacteroidota bacterium]MDX5431195.1 phosphoribosylformylglycinamidine synthase subunit PurL [Bacteroidota bacterium]MDX5469934.1 phosphoribosylformylglycinamidine synthase subunit PurL [Bacteroidota bacterium]